MSDKVRSAVAALIAARQIPGMVVATARIGAAPTIVALGDDGLGRPLAADSLFPVASVSKLATALLVLRLVDDDALLLDAPLAAYLPAAIAASEGVSVRRLLCHTAGLPLDVPSDAAPYAPGLTPELLGKACLATPLAAAPDTRVQYSNVGYGLLALAVEHVLHIPFPQALEQWVLAPLGIEGYLGQEPPRSPATLTGVRGSHAGSEIEPFNSPFWRSLALPWAGLLTTAEGALALVTAFANTPEGFLSEATRREATSNQAGDLAGGFAPPLLWAPCPWGLGPEVRGTKHPHWTGDAVSNTSFGHSGASGTLAWADPAAGLAFALLGARPADNGWLLRRAPALCTAVVESLTLTG